MHNLIVSGSPEGDSVLKAGLSNFKAVINVADSPCVTLDDHCRERTAHFWFPIHEDGYWGYSPFFGAAKVFDKYIPLGSVLIHCHAGINRSASVAAAILLAEGFEPEAVDLYLRREAMHRLNAAIKEKRVPNNIIDFLKVRKELPDYASIEQIVNKLHYKWL